MGWPELHELARRQAGRLRIDQAPACGVGVSTLQRRGRLEVWRRPQPGVVELPGAPAGWLGDAWAAVLSAGPGAMVAGLAAAHLHGLFDRAPLEIVVAADRNPRLRGNVRVRRSSTLIDSDVAQIDGLAVTNLERTIRDVAAWHGIDSGVGLFLDAVQQRRTTSRRLRRRLALPGPLAGSGGLREACDLAESGIESSFEALIPPMLARAGLPPMQSQVPVQVGRRTLHLDFGWPDIGVAVECVGLRPHNSRLALRRDVRRMNALDDVKTWKIIWVEWTDLFAGRDDLVARLVDARRQRARDHRAS